MTYAETIKQIMPEGAVWSSSFGYPGEGGYVEYWCCPDGTRWEVGNGGWYAVRPFEWTVRKVEERK